MKKPKLIVSLTSFPARIGTVHHTIKTILDQTAQPDKIVLYLADDQFPGRKLPKELTGLEKKNSIFEIRWWPRDIRSFKKLVPALQEFPDDVIITFDDDLLYPDDIIESLLACHKKYPNAVCGARVRRIRTCNGRPIPYGRWKRYKVWRIFAYGGFPKYKNLATTGGGTLFPPRAMHPDTIREDIFMQLCPTTDDLWFWAMAALNGTKTAPARPHLDLHTVDGSQDESLRFDNCAGANYNDRNFKKILDRYPDLKKKLRLRK